MIVPHFDRDITELRTWLHLIVDDLKEEDIRLFFKMNDYMQDQGLSYLSHRYRLRQVLDFATRDLQESGKVFRQTFDPDLTSRLTWLNICSECNQKNKWTNAKICPTCERKRALEKQFDFVGEPMDLSKAKKIRDID